MNYIRKSKKELTKNLKLITKKLEIKDRYYQVINNRIHKIAKKNIKKNHKKTHYINPKK